MDAQSSTVCSPFYSGLWVSHRKRMPNSLTLYGVIDTVDISFHLPVIYASFLSPHSCRNSLVLNCCPPNAHLCVPARLGVCLPVCVSACLCECLPACVGVCLPVWVSACLGPTRQRTAPGCSAKFLGTMQVSAKSSNSRLQQVGGRGKGGARDGMT